MARSTSTNYTTPSFPKASADGDAFDATDLQSLAVAVDGHDHSAGKGVAIVARANLLANGGLEINQRGGTVTANNAYAHDRWQILLGGSSTISVTDETSIVDTGSGHALKVVYTHNANSQINQKIEDFASLKGRTLSLSVRVRQGVASNVRPYISDSGSKTYGTASATTASFVTLTVTLAIAAGATSINIGIDLGASDTVYLDNAMLVVGSVAADYAPLHPADDLARCLRYYEILGTNSNGDIVVGNAYAAAATTRYTSVPLKAEKAVAPTVTVVGTWAFVNGNTLSAGASGVRSIRLQYTVPAAGETYALNSGANTYVTVEANP